MSELVGPGSKYTDEDRKRAVVEYLVKGNMANVSRSLGIPEPTLCEWKKRDWWVQESERVRIEKGAELDAKMSQLIDSAFYEARDRLENGDYRLTKDGELVRVPMSGRDVVIAGATIYDKQRLHRNQPNSIKGDSASMEELAKRFAEISEQYEFRQVNSIDGQVMDTNDN